MYCVNRLESAIILNFSIKSRVVLIDYTQTRNILEMVSVLSSIMFPMGCLKPEFLPCLYSQLLELENPNLKAARVCYPIKHGKGAQERLFSGLLLISLSFYLSVIVFIKQLIILPIKY